MTPRAVLLTAISLLALSASPALAQKELFVAGVRELATAAASADPARSSGMKATVARMEAALAQWDRTISAVDARIVRDLDSARGRRAYELHLELAVTYLERGRLADAERHLAMASSAEPGAPEPPILRAATLELAGKRDDAARQWQIVWNSDRTNPIQAYQVLRSGGGADVERSGAAAVMRTAYERLLTTDEPARPLSIAAIGVIPDTWSNTPIVGDAATAEGFARLAEARYDDALTAFRRTADSVGRALSGSPREPDRVRAAEMESALARFNRGRELEKANHVREARREFEAALAGTLSGRNRLFAGIGRLAQVEGDFAGAIEAFQRAVQLNPNDVNMHREFAFAYAGQGAVDDAFHELIAALLLNPRDAQTFADIGRLFLDAGRDADALAPLQRALALAPSRYETRYALATGLTRLGRTADAARELEAFQQAQRQAIDRQRRSFPDSSR
jgi:tetratricopeptide (TPR) repeat protein